MPVFREWMLTLNVIEDSLLGLFQSKPSASFCDMSALSIPTAAPAALRKQHVGGASGSRPRNGKSAERGKNPGASRGRGQEAPRPNAGSGRLFGV